MSRFMRSVDDLSSFPDVQEFTFVIVYDDDGAHSGTSCMRLLVLHDHLSMFRQCNQTGTTSRKAQRKLSDCLSRYHAYFLDNLTIHS